MRLRGQALARIASYVTSHTSHVTRHLRLFSRTLLLGVIRLGLFFTALLLLALVLAALLPLLCAPLLPLLCVILTLAISFYVSAAVVSFCLVLVFVV